MLGNYCFPLAFSYHLHRIRSACFLLTVFSWISYNVRPSFSWIPLSSSSPPQILPLAVAVAIHPWLAITGAEDCTALSINEVGRWAWPDQLSAFCSTICFDGPAVDFIPLLSILEFWIILHITLITKFMYAYLGTAVVWGFGLVYFLECAAVLFGLL